MTSYSLEKPLCGCKISACAPNSFFININNLTNRLKQYFMGLSAATVYRTKDINLNRNIGSTWMKKHKIIHNEL